MVGGNVSLDDGRFENAEHCVCCGAVIPEGSPVCIICGLKANFKQSSADVVEVVHCKNCKHLMFSDCCGECEKGYMGIVSPDDYCSRGERKDGADND